MCVTINNNMSDTCFFCSKIINDKRSREHIIPNSLLGKLGLKQKTLTGQKEIEYSRIKVPSHKTCNSEFGSRYEETILNLLENPKKLYKTLKSQDIGIPIVYSTDYSETILISTWLLKIYYGLFYNDYLKTDDVNWKNISKNIIDSDNFRMVQKAYRENSGFYLPSSLYVFKSKNEEFDIRTFVYPQMIMLKIKSLTMVLSIGDGFLTKNYLNEEVLKDFRKFLKNEEKQNEKFPVHLFALAEIMALRYCIPKTPKFVYSEKKIMNMSMMTGVSNPHEYYKIDEEMLEKKRLEILEDFKIRMK
jgi:hypothetical protein